MKRLIIGLVLVVALVAISYFQWIRGKERDASIKIEAMKAGQEKIATQQSMADSLQALVESQDAAFADTLAERQETYQAETDSLTSVIEQQGGLIDSLQEANTQLAEQSTQTQQATKSKAAHKDILAYYKQEADKLPGDLSSYERRVALGEIRSRTARKFSITVKRLNEIRDRYNIDY